MGTRPIGIDLGTTYSCAAHVQNGKPVVIATRLGYTTLPSIVNYDEKGHVVVGQPAERRMILHPTQTIYGSKRLLGRTFEQSVIDRYQPHFDYELVADADGLVAAKMGDMIVPLVDVSAMILRELRMAVQTTLGERVESAVVTVPAYFNENQRAAVRKAADLAGLQILRILKEPTAAALCYGMGRGERKNVLVFDLGGGTFDISVINLNLDTFEVLGVGGDSFLGGIDFDRRLVKLVIERLAAKHRREVVLDPIGRERLRLACQDLKRQLSTQERTLLALPHFLLADGSQLDVSEVISREELERVTADLIDRCMEHVADTLRIVGKRPSEIDDVLLVGGQTRMIAVQKAIEKMFGKPATQRVHPDEAVALGAAIAADAHERSGPGAAILLDVVPMAIGFAAPNGDLVPVVARHTALPHETQVSVSIEPNKAKLELAVFQGDRMRASENDYLGTLVMDQLPERTDTVRCIITFNLNAEGLLQISAAIPQLEVRRSLKLVTRQASDAALSEVDVERVRVQLPRPSTANLPGARRSRASIPGPRPVAPPLPRPAPAAAVAPAPRASLLQAPGADVAKGAPEAKAAAPAAPAPAAKAVAPARAAKAATPAVAVSKVAEKAAVPTLAAASPSANIKTDPPSIDDSAGFFARVFGRDGWLRSMFR